MHGFDAWLTREPPDPVTDPHAPWMVVWLSVEGDHDYVEIAGRRGSWGVEHGGDVDAETTFVIGSYADAEKAAERCNARYAYDPATDRDPRSGVCRKCGDFHEEPGDEMARSELAEYEFPPEYDPTEGPTGIAAFRSGRYS